MFRWRCFMVGLLAVGCPSVFSRAEEPPRSTIPLNLDTLASLKEEYFKAAAARQALSLEARQAFQAATTDEERQAVENRIREKADELSSQRFSARFLKFAETHPKDSGVFEALHLALTNSGGPHGEKGVWKRVVELLEAGYIDHPEIKQTFAPLIDSGDAAAEKLVREVIAKNPDRKVQAKGCKLLLTGLQRSVQLSERLGEHPEDRPVFEQRFGAELIRQMVDRAQTAEPEIAELKELLAEKYADIYPDVSVGKAAPEIVCQNLEGTETRLSSLQGKVVVLDVWATWCKPCRELIPYERELMERLKEQPFALVSISIDADKQAVVDFLEKVPMPWTHWWNGAEGGLVESWQILNIPAIYVLDAKGVIRQAGIRGQNLKLAIQEMEKTVDELLAELTGRAVLEPEKKDDGEGAEAQGES